MSLVSESFHVKKLNTYNINIKTKYIVGNKILERNTNDSVNDDIKEGIRCEKEYYLGNKLIHKENKFDSRIEYTFLLEDMKEKETTCPNCGMTSQLKDFKDGCPYCKSYYNIDYIEKDLGSKYHYDRVLRNTKYRIVTAIIDFIISIILAYFFIKNTSRTFNNYDILKIFVFGGVLSLILYYFFYIVDAYFILSPIKKYKDKENQKQIDFWKRTNIDKKKFYNNLNYEVRKKYYGQEDIIDYDILDYLSFKEFYKNNQLYVRVKVEVRLIYYQNGKIISKYVDDNFTMKKIDVKEKLESGENVISCHQCGASIDVTKDHCEYCNSEITYLQEWILEK